MASVQQLRLDQDRPGHGGTSSSGSSDQGRPAEGLESAASSPDWHSQQGASAVTWLAEEAACSYSSKDVAQDHSQHSGAQDQLATRGAGQLQAPGSEASCQMHVAEIKTSC
jgi:hypothetical protein